MIFFKNTKYRKARHSKIYQECQLLWKLKQEDHLIPQGQDQSEKHGETPFQKIKHTKLQKYATKTDLNSCSWKMYIYS